MGRPFGYAQGDRPFLTIKCKVMIKVLFLKSHPDYGYFANDVGTVTPEAAEKLLKKGYILPLPEEDKGKMLEKENPLPEGLPGRTVIYDAGFNTLEKIKEAGDSLLDCGISAATLKKVKKFLEGYVFEA
jgi:hypothetical protein